MKFKIDGSYVNGTDIGHPDGVDIFTACCCGFVAGNTSEERDAKARLVVAAPEMYELIQMLVRTWEDDCQFIPCDTEAASELSYKLARLATQAVPLLAKIEGGGNENHA